MSIPFSGGTYVNTTFLGETKQDAYTNLKTNLATAGWSRAVLGVGQGPGNVATVTITIASPGVVSFASHGFLGTERVILQTTGALPTGLSANTVYFVLFVDANSFRLATSSGGTAINTSGSQSGVHTLYSESILFESATQSNVTNPIRVRLKDNRGTALVVTFSIENAAGSVVGGSSGNAGGHIQMAAGITFRLVATKYHFMFMRNGAPSDARQWVWCGMPYVPTFLTSVTDVGFMFCNTDNDSRVQGSATGSVAVQSLRVCNMLTTDSNASVNWQCIYNSGINENAANGNTTALGSPFLLIPYPLRNNSSIPSSVTAGSYRWAGDQINTAPVPISWGVSGTAVEAKIRGVAFDLTYIAEAYAVDSTDTFNGHSWININNNNTAIPPRGGVWFATS